MWAICQFQELYQAELLYDLSMRSDISRCDELRPVKHHGTIEVHGHDLKNTINFCISPGVFYLDFHQCIAIIFSFSVWIIFVFVSNRHYWCIHLVYLQILEITKVLEIASLFQIFLCQSLRP